MQICERSQGEVAPSGGATPTALASEAPPSLEDAAAAAAAAATSPSSRRLLSPFASSAAAELALGLPVVGTSSSSGGAAPRTSGEATWATQQREDMPAAAAASFSALAATAAISAVQAPSGDVTVLSVDTCPLHRRVTLPCSPFQSPAAAAATPRTPPSPAAAAALASPRTSPLVSVPGRPRQAAAHQPPTPPPSASPRAAEGRLQQAAALIREPASPSALRPPPPPPPPPLQQQQHVAARGAQSRLISEQLARVSTCHLHDVELRQQRRQAQLQEEQEEAAEEEQDEAWQQQQQHRSVLLVPSPVPRRRAAPGPPSPSLPRSPTAPPPPHGAMPLVALGERGLAASTHALGGHPPLPPASSHHHHQHHHLADLPPGPDLVRPLPLKARSALTLSGLATPTGAPGPSTATATATAGVTAALRRHDAFGASPTTTAAHSALPHAGATPPHAGSGPHLLHHAISVPARAPPPPPPTTTAAPPPRHHHEGAPSFAHRYGLTHASLLAAGAPPHHHHDGAAAAAAAAAPTAPLARASAAQLSALWSAPVSTSATPLRHARTGAAPPALVAAPGPLAGSVGTSPAGAGTSSWLLDHHHHQQRTQPEWRAPLAVPAPQGVRSLQHTPVRRAHATAPLPGDLRDGAAAGVGGGVRLVGPTATGAAPGLLPPPPGSAQRFGARAGEAWQESGAATPPAGCVSRQSLASQQRLDTNLHLLEVSCFLGRSRGRGCQSQMGG